MDSMSFPKGFFMGWRDCSEPSRGYLFRRWHRTDNDQLIADGEGIKFYNDVFDELLKHGIEPVVKIFHFDVSFSFIKNYESQVFDLFETYAITLFTRYNGKVKYLITFNEINMLLHLPFIGAGIVF